ncbi:MAG: hypothetical protein M3Y18_07955 [Candidatus Eremiobacteraeota bacterium]|nr:hypothetical protein [Candidatus Eremiobacteraeota bacterium]
MAATSGDGATLVFRPAPAGGQAFQLQLYAGRPDGSATPAASGPPADFDASVTETTLGAPPFSIFVTSAGYPSGAASYPPASGALEPIATEPACPAGGYRLRLQAGASSAERILPCG